MLLKGLLLLVTGASAFYLPGVAPKNYKKDEKIDFYVNTVSSASAVLSYDYYYGLLFLTLDKIHFCKPASGIAEPVHESLGSALFGDRLYRAPFELNMLKDEKCKSICNTIIPKKDVEFIQNLIKSKYNTNWMADGLPVAVQLVVDDPKNELYQVGFPIGHVDAETSKVSLNTHFEITINYHEEKGEYRIVGFFVAPQSIQSTPSSNCVATQDNVLYLNGQEQNVGYTYSVTWKQSDIPWATRWDHYLHIADPKIHWWSLVNSMIVAFFLAGMIGMILLRTLRRDILRYNSFDEEDATEEYGWKLIHGDVFRAPKYYNLFSAFLGSGAQVFLMLGVVLIFACLGLLSPSSRGSLTTVMVVCFMAYSSIAGYISARTFKMFGGEKWKRNVMFTSLIVPGWILGSVIILNFFLIGEQSSGAVPFGTLFAVVALWLLISFPLCCYGAYKGYRSSKIQHPVRTNQIPRQIPEKPFYLKTIPSMLIGGILPFGAILIELNFIVSGIWSGKLYYMFGFLFLVFLLLIVTCAEVAILMTYFRLCAEDYHWWWSSFLVSGGSAIYVFLFGIMASY